MGSIRKAAKLNVSPDTVWDAVRDFGAPHTRLVPGFVTGVEMDGEDRIVTFANGAVQREPLVSVDDEERRLVYSAVDSPLGATHYNAAVQVTSNGEGTSRLVWLIDFLPDTISSDLEAAMERGVQTMEETLENSE
jgi:polyketide cyclase/dehydrase/lipid transport protein